MRKKTTAEFIADACKVHGDKYDYSKVEYVGNKRKVCIICPEHGEFWQAPNAHLRNHGCQSCGGGVKKDTDSFVASARQVHGDRYSYNDVAYVNARTKVKIICKIHGEFLQSPNDHLDVCGCPKCGRNNSACKNDFVSRAVAVHGLRYEYSKCDYKTTDDKVAIICHEHGIFMQTPHDHLNGHGCPDCGAITGLNKKTLTISEFIDKAKEIHGDKYDYSKTSYSGCRGAITVTCKKHGDFTQQAYVHLAGHGCPACGQVLSKGENEAFELIKQHCPDAQQRVRDVIPPLELDIYIPSLKLAIEYNGEFWHSVDKKGKNYHLNKRHSCEAVGVRLISVCETDWKTKRERVERIILNAIGKTSGKTVYARKCAIREVICKDYRAFMNENHIQGYAIATHRYGLYHDDELVACMGFKQLKDGAWDCVRYATSCRVPGGHSKLFKFMAKELNMETAQSFVDMDFFTGSSYREEDGWVDSGSETVGFRVWHQKVGFMPRQKWWKDFIPKTLEQLGANPAIYDRNKKQRQMMAEAGCLVIENSGNKKFVWHK